MESLLDTLFQQFEPLEWLVFWIAIFVVPIGALAGAILAFRDRETGKAMVWLGVGILLLALIGLLLWNMGARLAQLTMDSIGGWVIGLLIAGAICLVALPMGLVGGQLRRAFEYGRRGYWSSGGGRSLIVGMLGLLVIGVVVFLALGSHILIGMGLGVLALIALSLGWFGRFLVPEIIDADEREPLERPIR